MTPEQVNIAAMCGTFAQEAHRKCLQDIGSWNTFLEQSGRFYKYWFPAQLQIYVQRPSATACAAQNIWTDKMNRVLRDDAAPIFVFSRNSYVDTDVLYDIMDTEKSIDGIDPKRWAILPGQEQEVSNRLGLSYGMRGRVSLQDRIWAVLWQEIRQQKMKPSIADLAGCMVYARAGIPIPEKLLFRSFAAAQNLSFNDFLTAGTDANIVGHAVLSRINTILTVMRQESIQKGGQDNGKTDRSAEILGRAATHPQSVPGEGEEAGVSPASQYGSVLRPGHRGDAESRSVRGDNADWPMGSRKGEVPEAGATGILHGAAEQRSVERTPSGSRRSSLGNDGFFDGADGTGAGRDGTDEIRGSDEVGGSDEQHPGRSKGDRSSAVDPHITPNNTQFSKAEAENASAFPVSPEKSASPAIAYDGGQNFRITNDAHGIGTASQHYKANVAAIRCLKRLEQEQRAATPSEKEILAQYVGWGGLADVFDPRHSKYQEIRNLLSPEEYQRAKASTLDAHYTSPVIIKAMYHAVSNLGFAQGKVLEPAMGIGSFFGALPESMAGSELYGVELDSLSGRIAQKIYPNAHITIAGYETTKQHDFYDLAIGNIPFGQVKVHDPAFNHLNFSIHNYFFAKAIDQVRPGGIIAFVTSHYTLDAKTSKARKYIAERAELLGAIRLPNNAFKANAGTNVVSDIIFLQKREAPAAADPDWLRLETTADGFTLNSYFVQNPDMVLGQLAWESTPYGENECTVIPIPGKSLSEQLQGAIQKIAGKYIPMQAKTSEQKLPADELPHDPSLRPWSYAIRNNEIYYQEDGALLRREVGATVAARIQGMIELRECVRSLITIQLDPSITDEVLQVERSRLNNLYDGFVKKYGLICTRSNRLAFREDSAYPLLLSLEVLDEDGIYVGKADIFTRRTVRPSVPVVHVDTAAEALAVSIGEKAHIDIEYMSQLTGKSPAKLEEDLTGVIFRDITCNIDAKRIPFQDVDLQKYQLVPADEYLSGNVRQKLRMAKAMLEAIPADKRKFVQANVDALEKAQPQDLEATEISVRLGATWIPPEDIRQFLLDVLKPPVWAARSIKVEYSTITGEWFLEGKKLVPYRDVNATVTYGTSRIDAYELVERTLNMREVRIYDTVRDREGTHQIFNPKETVLAQQRQQLIQDKFRDWIWEDPERRNRLVKKYNEQFNSTKPREYDGSHIVFGGINPEIQLRPHQLGAIAHILYGGNTLLAHCVGAGKTFEMIASIMESKRLGLSSKAMIAVPNHLTDQWSNEFLSLYPSANILVAHEEDFSKENRRSFFGRIATGDYDAIIIGQSQFERIPVSLERRKAWLQNEINELQDGIDALQASRGEYFSVKQIERQKRNLEARLEKLADGSSKDYVVNFEELGIDRLYVDEAHAYKNLYCFTKMTRVAGLSTAESQRATDMLMKCRYLDELTNNRGIVFATGTPVSNTMVELYTMQRYLQYRRLQELGLASFDAWASVFGETVTAMELAPEGSGYRTRTRFAKFYNLPELMNLFKEIADIKTADQLNLPVPEAIYHTEVCKPTEAQIEMVKELSRRASAIHNGSVDPSIDNMLRITSDGRKLGLDQRIIEPLLPDEPFSKVNRCVYYVLEDWKNSAADKLTQVIFCDLSTPQKAAKGAQNAPAWDAAQFSVYEDIRTKLIQNGVPAEEIAFIHDADTSAKKRKLFGKVRSGEVRILLGSTAKMGAGTNVQDRLLTLHDLDCPWRPGDLEQRSGRIIRQGNRNKQVNIRRYVTEGTFDAYLWQTVEIKQRFISQILTSKSPVRTAEDIDDVALSYAEIKSMCAGDPRVKEKMDLDVEVSKLQILKASYQSQRYAMQNRLLYHFPEQIERYKEFISALQSDAETVLHNPEPTDDFVGITLCGSFYKDKLDAGETLLALCGQQAGSDKRHIGSFRGFQLYLEKVFSQHVLYLRGKAQHEVVLGQDPRGNFIRINNVLNAIPAKITETQQLLDDTYKQIENTKMELEKPFAQEAELYQKNQRLIELNAELNMDVLGTDKEKNVECDSPSLC